MQKPLISVIIPIYKVEQYLTQCIDSVIRQTYTNLEIILVDDGSPDNCGAICDEYAQNDHRIKVIHQTNQGLAAARNAGMDLCTGDLIAFVDSDDWIEPEMYERMTQMMLDKDLDVVFCGVTHIRDGEVLEYMGQYYEDGAVVSAEEIIPYCLTKEILPSCCNRLCRRHCVENMRFPEGWIYEDLPVSHIPFTKANRPVGFLHEPLYNYRRSMGGITSNPEPCNAIYLFMGWMELYQYAKKNVPAVRMRCLDRLVKAAMNVCNYEVRCPECDLFGDVRIVECFLRENLREILRCPQITSYRKFIVLLRLYARPLHGILYRMLKA